jgi:lysophospholipase L1-like esterase
MKNKGILYGGLGLLLSMSLLFYFANYEVELSIGELILNKSKDLKWIEKPGINKVQDTVQSIISKKDTVNVEIPDYDTANKNILLVGDSQAEGIMDPLYNYTHNSGHDFKFALTWYSATDIIYGATDTLKNTIERIKPDYIIVVLGLNQIFQSHFEPSRKAVKSILNTIGETPFSWIGPANWVEDKGINQVYEELLPKGTFFLSKNITLPRGPDGRHPSYQGYRIWMDSIATWLNTKAKWKMNMVKPLISVNTRGFRFKTLNAGKRKTTEAKKETDSLQLEIPVDSTEENLLR